MKLLTKQSLQMKPCHKLHKSPASAITGDGLFSNVKHPPVIFALKEIQLRMAQGAYAENVDKLSK